MSWRPERDADSKRQVVAQQETASRKALESERNVSLSQIGMMMKRKWREYEEHNAAHLPPLIRLTPRGLRAVNVAAATPETVDEEAFWTHKLHKTQRSALVAEASRHKNDVYDEFLLGLKTLRHYEKGSISKLAALALQKSFKRHLYQTKYRVACAGIQLLQAVGRGGNVRRWNLGVSFRRLLACRLIERIGRGYLRRREYFHGVMRDLIAKRRQAGAIKLQKTFRMYQVRAPYVVFRKSTRAARIIQLHVRPFLARQRENRFELLYAASQRVVQDRLLIKDLHSAELLERCDLIDFESRQWKPLHFTAKKVFGALKRLFLIDTLSRGSSIPAVVKTMCLDEGQSIAEIQAEEAQYQINEMRSRSEVARSARHKMRLTLQKMDQHEQVARGFLLLEEQRRFFLLAEIHLRFLNADRRRRISEPQGDLVLSPEAMILAENGIRSEKVRQHNENRARAIDEAVEAKHQLRQEQEERLRAQIVNERAMLEATLKQIVEHERLLLQQRENDVKKHAATLIQSCFRGFRDCKSFRRQRSQQSGRMLMEQWAVQTVQETGRGFLARLNVMRRNMYTN